MSTVGSHTSPLIPDGSASQNKRKSLDERTAAWIRRRGTKQSGFYYIDISGERIRDKETLARIKSLVIPPAWTNVRITPKANGALQVLGTDTSGRVQYMYHKKFTERQEKKKFAKIEQFGEHLPNLRKASSEHLQHSEFTKERVLAIIVRLINDLYFRVGSDLSVKRYKTFGVTTLLSKHLTILPKRKNGRPALLQFDFIGKHHIRHRRIMVDEKLASIMSEMKAMPGARLFKYIGEDGKLHPVRPSDVNAYIKSLTGNNFTAKDFRTWGGTLLAAIELAEQGIATTVRESRKRIVAAVKKVAEHLGNTPSIARSSYIHPLIIKAFERGRTLAQFRKRASRKERHIKAEEQALLKLLRSK